MTMTPAKVYPLTIPANGAFPLQCWGTFFKVLSASGSFEVAGDTFGQLGVIQAGQGLRIESDAPGKAAVPFQRLTFRDRSGAANTLQVLVAGDGFIDDRVTGEVSVIDGAKARTMGGIAYSGLAYAGAVAGQYSFAQLFNHAANNVQLVVSQIFVASSVANWSAKMTLSAGSVGVTVGAPAAKRAGGADAFNVFLQAHNQVGVALAGEKQLGLFYGPATVTQCYKLTDPVVIPPGYALNVSTSSAFGLDVAATYEFYVDPL